jgi:hypothetical protein
MAKAYELGDIPETEPPAAFVWGGELSVHFVETKNENLNLIVKEERNQNLKLSIDERRNMHRFLRSSIFQD